jgi:predicted component of type VI protein secretion system
MHRRHRLVSAPLAALALAALALFVSACGYSSDSKQVAEGEVVKLGELKYQVVFSRFLNRNDNEDSAYLVGQPPPKNGSNYFGVFLEVQNKSEETQALADSATISDASNEKFEAIPSESLYAFPFGGKVESQEPIPAPDSTPQQGPIEGSLVLFELPSAASESRPLTLSIPGPGGPAEVKLDL